MPEMLGGGVLGMGASTRERGNGAAKGLGRNTPVSMELSRLMYKLVLYGVLA